MVYFDPPYGIKYNSNFQPEIGIKEVKDREEDLTREPEMVKAYRDTWHLGIHSYLTYLRDRLQVARDLLRDTGSIFIQISDENLSLMSLIADEVFGRTNKIQIITFTKKFHTQMTKSIADYILWYAKDKKKMTTKPLLRERGKPADVKEFKLVETETGERKKVGDCTKEEKSNPDKFLNASCRVTSQEYREGRTNRIQVQGKSVFCGEHNHWRYSEEGMQRLEKAERLVATSKSSASGVIYWGDFNIGAPSNIWDGFSGETQRVYAVQTNWKIVERCILMTTKPGDLVLDPTCGSGTTAYVAEKWGRRWITIDSSRVAIATARKRLLTSAFRYFKLKDSEKGVSGDFQYETKGKITLKAIAYNEDLDPIFSEYDSILEEKLRICNQALAKAKIQRKGKEAVDAGDLPSTKKGFEHGNIPFRTNSQWPSNLSEAVDDYRRAWREKMEKVNKCIENNAPQIELIDKPIAERGTLRVTGPFSVEAFLPPADPAEEDSNARAYIDRIINFLRKVGIRFPNTKQHFSSINLLGRGPNVIHAKGRWESSTDSGIEVRDKSVAVVCGPQYGPVTASQTKKAIEAAKNQKYDVLVIAGFSFDGAAQAAARDYEDTEMLIHMAHICPDIHPGMSDLLRTMPDSQLFVVFGEPRMIVNGPDKDGYYTVRLEGVDVYNPTNNSVTSSNHDKVAAWFLDNDYDGQTFCPAQAFFPSQKSWKDIKKGSRSSCIDSEVFTKLSSNESLPFEPGNNFTIAVKVIDPRGNEVMAVHELEKRT